MSTAFYNWLRKLNWVKQKLKQARERRISKAEEEHRLMQDIGADNKTERVAVTKLLDKVSIDDLHKAFQLMDSFELYQVLRDVHWYKIHDILHMIPKLTRAEVERARQVIAFWQGN